MPSSTEPWFVAERSEALAGLLLTSRDDVSIRHERKLDNGIDFFVEIETGDPLSMQQFVVQVKGTASSDPSDWMQDVKQLFREPGSSIYLPVCVFVVDVRHNKALYAWVAEPFVEPNGVKLRFHEQGNFQPLDSTVVGEIISQVKAWYEALPKQLTPD